LERAGGTSWASQLKPGSNVFREREKTRSKGTSVTCLINAAQAVHVERPLMSRFREALEVLSTMVPTPSVDAILRGRAVAIGTE